MNESPGESTELESRIDLQGISIPYLTLNGQKTEIVAADPFWNELGAKIEKVASTTTNITIFGETGTGKEKVAEAIHRLSGRTGKLIFFDCGGASKNGFEYQLFGDTQRNKGLCRIAEHGTLVFDEIDELDAALQPKLSTLLDNRVIRPIGSEEQFNVDVRIICTANADLNQLVRSGKLREDIFYRLMGHQLGIKPLRERKQDILPLVADSLAKSEFNKAGRVRFISQQVLEILEAYSWPVNVRELNSAIESAYSFCSGDTLLVEHLPNELKRFDQQRREVDKPISLGDFPSLRVEIERIRAEVLTALQPEVEKRIDEQLRGYVTLILHLTRGNLLRAAKILRTDPAELDQLLSTLNIPNPVAVSK